jgi:hypothetical protein
VRAPLDEGVEIAPFVADKLADLYEWDVVTASRSPYS